MAHEKIKELTREQVEPLQKRVDQLNILLLKKTSSKELYKERFELWNKISSIRTEAFKSALIEEYGLEGNPKFERAFEIAWEFGHSSGFSEVENYFDSLVELIK